MQALGTFDAAALAKLPATINALSDGQVALLSQYYFLTRGKAGQDAYLYALQQQGATAAQLAAANAEIADLLATMNAEIAACYAQLAVLPQPVVYCAQVCYASVPGWCCHVGCFVPPWYFTGGRYVGPCLKAAWSGPWAVPVCKVYFDHGSHFYAAYHKFAAAAHISHSTSLAKLHVALLRKGDWHGALAHDRLVHHAESVVHTPVHTDIHTPAVHGQAVKPRVTTPIHTDVRKPVVHEAKPKFQARHVAAPHPHSPKPAVHSAKITTRSHGSSHASRATHAGHAGHSGGHKR